MQESSPERAETVSKSKGDQALAQVAWRGYRISILEDIQKMPGRDLVHFALGVPAGVGVGLY